MLNATYARLVVLFIFSACVSCSKHPFESMDSSLFGVNITRTHIVIPSLTSTGVQNVFEGCPGKNCKVWVFTRLSVNNAFKRDGEIVVGRIRMYKNDRLVLSAISNKTLLLQRAHPKPSALARLWVNVPAAKYKITELDTHFFERVINESEPDWVHTKTEPAWSLHNEKLRIEADYLLKPPGYDEGEATLSFTPTHFPIFTETEQRSYNLE